MSFRLPSFLLFVLLSWTFCFAEEAPPGATTDPARPVVWLGFPILGRDRQPPEIHLVKDRSLGSAFLLQLRRQALLMAARDELGAVTRDAFLGENVEKKPSVFEISDIDQFPAGRKKNEPVLAKPDRVDHRRFLAEQESRSRNEYVRELERLGVEKQAMAIAKAADLDESCSEIESLLRDWALIPQLDAVRRTHALIRKQGETPDLLALLVKGYTQLQIQTNYAPLDTHRVFQARAMLYAQRLVAEYGDEPEHLALRAAAWSLNNFHRLARLEFQEMIDKKLEIPDDFWIRAARCYADFDIRGLENMMEKADSKTEKPTLLLFKYLLLELSGNLETLARPFGERILSDLPDCTRLYLSVFNINEFDMIHAPDRSPFYEHLARRTAPALRKMDGLPETVRDRARKLGNTVKKASAGLFGLFGGGNVSHGFPKEQYYLDLAEVLEALRESGDSGEPSLEVTALLVRDDEYKIVQEVAYGIRGHNGPPEIQILPSLPVLEDHPAFGFLGLASRDHAIRSPYWHQLTVMRISYNLFSLHCTGFTQLISDTDGHGRIYSPYFFACLYADRENVRDMIEYHRVIISTLRQGEHYFLVDLIYDLCPENPQAVSIRLARAKDLDIEQAERLLERFKSYPNVRREATAYHRRTGNNKRVLELMEEDFQAKPTLELTCELSNVHLAKGKRKQAIGRKRLRRVGLNSKPSQSRWAPQCPQAWSDIVTTAPVALSQRAPRYNAFSWLTL